MWAVLPAGSGCVGRPDHCSAAYLGAVDRKVSWSEQPADVCRLKALTFAKQSVVCGVTLDPAAPCVFVESTAAWLRCHLQSWLETQPTSLLCRVINVPGKIFTHSQSCAWMGCDCADSSYVPIKAVTQAIRVSDPDSLL